MSLSLFLTKGWALVGGLFVLIVVLAIAVFLIPGPDHARSATAGITATTELGRRIVVDYPAPGSTVGSPINIIGSAPGSWFFEATFPVELRRADGTLIEALYASAQGEWMTTDLVPFIATIDPGDCAGAAILVLKRDNPSGLPENEDSISLPITIAR